MLTIRPKSDYNEYDKSQILETLIERMEKAGEAYFTGIDKKGKCVISFEYDTMTPGRFPYISDMLPMLEVEERNLAAEKRRQTNDGYKYNVFVSCNPHHANYHLDLKYHKDKVTKYDGNTPVEWIELEDVTRAEAEEYILDEMTRYDDDYTCDDDWFYIYDNSIAQRKWGFFDSVLFQSGETCARCDVVSYEIRRQ